MQPKTTISKGATPCAQPLAFGPEMKKRRFFEKYLAFIDPHLRC
jgi:hypothetical protein